MARGEGALSWKSDVIRPWGMHVPGVGRRVHGGVEGPLLTETGWRAAAVLGHWPRLRYSPLKNGPMKAVGAVGFPWAVTHTLFPSTFF